jgi:hypothetical protein
MLEVSNKEFLFDQEKYFDMAVKDDIYIQNGENIFNPTCHSSACIYLILRRLHFIRFINGGLRLFFSFSDLSA